MQEVRSEGELTRRVKGVGRDSNRGARDERDRLAYRNTDRHGCLLELKKVSDMLLKAEREEGSEREEQTCSS